MAYTIDTAASIEDLKSSGIEDEQARAIVRLVAVSDSQLATKADIAVLKAELSIKIYLMGGAVVGVLKGLEYLGV